MVSQTPCKRSSWELIRVLKWILLSLCLIRFSSSWLCSGREMVGWSVGNVDGCTWAVQPPALNTFAHVHVRNRICQLKVLCLRWFAKFVENQPDARFWIFVFCHRYLWPVISGLFLPIWHLFVAIIPTSNSTQYNNCFLRKIKEKLKKYYLAKSS